MIIWGKKYVYRRLGYVADFCPLCREVRVFELKRVGLAGHIYYISLTEGELAGHQRKCTSCGTDLNAKPEIYARPSMELRTLRELLAHKAKERFRASLIDGQAIAVFFGALIVGGMVATGLVAVLPQYEEAIWITVGIGSVVFTWICRVWSRRRFIRNDILPPLLPALHPLKPTPGGITVVLQDMNALGLRIGSKIKPGPVMAGLKSYVPPKPA